MSPQIVPTQLAAFSNTINKKKIVSYRDSMMKQISKNPFNRSKILFLHD